MKALQLVLMAVIVIAAGCMRSVPDPGPEATLVAAEEFAGMLMDELDASGAVEVDGRGGSASGNVYTKEIRCSIPSASCPADKLHSTARAALGKWGEFETYPSKGEGGGLDRFELHFGSHRSHAFIDVLASPNADKTRVLILIRVLE